MPVPHASNTKSRRIASNVRSSQRGHVAHSRSSLGVSGRGQPSRMQLQGLAFSSKPYGYGMRRVGVSHWQVTGFSGLTIVHLCVLRPTEFRQFRVTSLGAAQAMPAQAWRERLRRDRTTVRLTLRLCVERISRLLNFSRKRGTFLSSGSVRRPGRPRGRDEGLARCQARCAR